LGFPLSNEGTVVIDTAIYPELSPAVIVDRLRGMLMDAKASDVSTVVDTVEFKNVFFRLVWNWNILVPYEAGSFSVAAQGRGLEVRYDLSTRRMLRTVSGLVGFFAAIFVAGLVVPLATGEAGASETMQEIPNFAILFVIAWLWLFGMNYIVAKMRMPSWLKDGLIR
jgi:hypothetical protein